MKTVKKITWEPSNDIDPLYLLGWRDPRCPDNEYDYQIYRREYKKSVYGGLRWKVAVKYLLEKRSGEVDRNGQPKMIELSHHNSIRTAKIRAQQLENEKAPV